MPEPDLRPICSAGIVTGGSARQIDDRLPPEFSIDVTLESGVRVIAVRGDLDMASAPQLRFALQGATGDTRAVLVDLCGVTFIDSSGLTALIQGQARLRERGRRVAIARTEGGAVAQVFELTAIATILDLHASRAAAWVAAGPNGAGDAR